MATKAQVKANIHEGLVTRAGCTLPTESTPAGVGLMFSISDVIVDEMYDGIDFLENVKSIYNPTAALPAAPAVGDSYISSATARGWTAGHVYQWSGNAWIDTPPQEGMIKWVDNEDLFYYYSGTTWLKFGTQFVHGLDDHSDVEFDHAPVTGDILRYSCVQKWRSWTPTQNDTVTGLSSDFLDGLHASAFALTGHTHTSAGITDFSSASRALFSGSAPITYNSATGAIGITQSGIDHGSIGGREDDDHTQYYNQARGDARYCLGNDSRLSDARTPIAHAVNASTYGYGDATNAGHFRAGTNLTAVDGTLSLASSPDINGTLDILAGNVINFYRTGGDRFGSIWYDGGSLVIRQPASDGLVIQKNDGTSLVAFDTAGKVTCTKISLSENGLGSNLQIGDDAYIGDVNAANTISIRGVQDSTYGYIIFGSSNSTALGRAGSGALTYGGNEVWNSSSFPKSHAVNASTYGYGDSTNAGHARAGTGITALNGTFSVAYGNTGSTACVGDDSRLSNARTPTAHTLGSHSDYSTYIDQAVKTGSVVTFGGITSTSYIKAASETLFPMNSGYLSGTASGYVGLTGNSSGHICYRAYGGSEQTIYSTGNKPSPSDLGAAPTAHAVNASTYGYGDSTNAGHARAGTGITASNGTFSVAYGNTGSTACVGNDGRLSDARTPTAHTLGSHSDYSTYIDQAVKQASSPTFANMTVSATSVSVESVINCSASYYTGSLLWKENSVLKNGLRYNAMTHNLEFIDGNTATIAYFDNSDNSFVPSCGIKNGSTVWKFGDAAYGSAGTPDMYLKVYLADQEFRIPAKYIG